MPDTHYLPIRLNTVVLPKVGAYVPSRYAPTEIVNVIVYLHGNIIFPQSGNATCGTDPGRFQAKGIESYLDTPLFRCLREGLEDSGAHAILVAPTLSKSFGSNSPSYAPRYGNLDSANKFDFLVNQAVTHLVAKQALAPNLRIGHVILAGHSAGGVAMIKILAATNTLKAQIGECWGFECLYFGTDTWRAWLKANPGKAFRHYRQPGQQINEAHVLAQQPNLLDVARGTSHCELLKQYWREAIDACPLLRPTDAVA